MTSNFLALLSKFTFTKRLITREHKTKHKRAQLNKTRLTLFRGENLDKVGSFNVSEETSASTWSSLGLDGWSGALVPAVVAPNTIGEYSNSDIFLDLEIVGKNSDVDNIYIVRVNDPFGTSVKQEFRNSTGRPKRDVLILYSIIQYATGCQPFVYKGNGCFCGFSGAGVPIDGIDKCYEYSNCMTYLEYFVPYIWKCYRLSSYVPLCTLDHGEFGGPGSCASRLCQCDVQLSLT